MAESPTGLESLLEATGAACFQLIEKGGAMLWMGGPCPFEGVPPCSLEDLLSRVEPAGRAALEAALRHPPAEVEVRMRPGAPGPEWLLVRARRLSSGAVGAAFVDASESRRARDEQSAQRDRIDAVLADSAVGVCYADVGLGRERVAWNARCKQHHGLPAEAQITGEIFWDRVHPDDRERLKREIDEAVSRRRPLDTVYRTVDAATGAVRWIRSISRPGYDAAGRWSRLDGVTFDVSDFARTLDERTAALQDTTGQIEMFSSTLAHDLRSPLRHMHGFCELLRLELAAQLGAQGLDYVARIERAAERLDALTRDLLVYSRVARGDLPAQALDLDRLADGLLDAFPQFREGAAELRVERPLGRVLANEGALAQCLANLVGNALRFVAPGRSPQVTLRSERQPRRRRLWVEDNGIGIDPRYHRKVFGSFERLKGKEANGTGIGLAIVKRAVERMDGAVGVESRLGEGSRFWIELPSI